MESSSRHLRQVCRRLLRAPLFTIVAMITLAAGVGGNTVIFSVVEGVLLRPLPYPESDRLIGVWITAPGVNIKDLNLSAADYFIFREQNRTLEDIGLYQSDSVSVTGAAEPEQVDALDVTQATLPLLGIVPAVGRLFTQQDDSPGAPATALLGYGYWRKKFAGDPSVIGRTLIIEGTPRQVIGVLPEKFTFLDQPNPSFIVCFQLDRSKTHVAGFNFRGVARLKPGVTLEQANADIARMLPMIPQTFPAPPGFSLKMFEDAHLGPNARLLKQDVIGDIGSVLWVLMGSIGLVLLIACANVANLLLVRVEGRRQELALRSALGASRGRIASDLLAESVTLGLTSSLLGLGLAWVALRVLIRLAPTGIPRLQEIGIDATVLLFTLAIAVLASFLFGAIPVFKYAGVHLSTGIREGGRALSQSREQHRARSILVAFQVALALVLLICSGLMIRTFRALIHVNPGVASPELVQTFRVYVPDSDIKEPESVIRLYEQVLHKIEAIPGVSSAAISTSVPFDNQTNSDPVFAQDRTYREGELAKLRRFVYIGPGFFTVAGTPFVAGRDLTWTDTYQRRNVVIISENFAREYWDTPQNALGKRVRVTSKDEWREVIGVVADVRKDGVSQPPPMVAYWPMIQNRFESDEVSLRRSAAFSVRTSRAGSESLMKDLRQAVWSADPNLPLYSVHTMGFLYERSMARTSFTLVMLAVAGGMALLLGVVGIYGVIAYSVSQRTREIGIRMALGAQQNLVTNMFVRHGLQLAAIGAACGLVIAIFVVRLMSSLLFNVSAIDPLTYVVVCAVLLAAAFLASYLPSRRAATVDPVDALRAE
jgi:putative ABC transport system permease protein